MDCLCLATSLDVSYLFVQNFLFVLLQLFCNSMGPQERIGRVMSVEAICIPYLTHTTTKNE